MRILLVSPNRTRFPYPVYPLGLDYVAGALAPAHEVRILDLCPLPDGEVDAAVAGAIRDFRPEAVGITVRNIDDTDGTSRREFVPDVARVVRAVKQASRAPVVLGGSGFTLYPADVLAATGADLGLVGEGERAREVFDALAAGRDPAALPGVVTRGGPAPCGPPPRVALGRRPLPPANPALPFYLAHGGILNLQTQRGCPSRCIYCTYPSIEGTEFRRRPADEVAAEAVALQAAGARYLFVTDAVFNGVPAHALEVAAAFRRAGLSIPWGAYFAPTSPFPGFFERLAEAGCTHAEFGTEALSDPILRRIRKAFRREHALAAHRAARKAGLHAAHFLILAGPGETRETLAETLDTAAGLPDGVFFFFCGMRVFRGTELARIAADEGLIAAGASLLAPVYYRTPALALEEVEATLRARADAHPNWIVGSGEAATHRVIQSLHARGHAGPLWEHLART